MTTRKQTTRGRVPPVHARPRDLVLEAWAHARGGGRVSTHAVAEPSDKQGARFNLAAVVDGRTWEEMEEADA